MKFRTLFTVWAAPAFLALGISHARAATFTVTNLDDTGIGSLRHAILSADIVSGADIVEFQGGLTGTIHLSADEGQLLIIGDLEIHGPGPAALTVSGDHVTRVFSISAESTVTISGLSIRNGEGARAGSNTTQGGGIFNSGNLTLDNCTVSGNNADLGGGIFNTGTATLSDCLLSENLGIRGGGMESSGVASLTNCTFSSNVGNQNGGGMESSGTATLTRCTFSGNSSDFNDTFQSGGGGGLSTFDQVTLTDCVFSGNSGRFAGGGMTNFGTAALINCTFFANFTTSASSSDTFGGAICHFGGGEVTLQNCAVTGNGSINGGGISNFGDMNLKNCTVSGNIATKGGGISNTKHPDSDGPVISKLKIENSTLSGNRAFDGGGIFNFGTVSLINCTLSGNRADSGGGINNSIRSGSAGTVTLGNTIVTNSASGLNCVNHDGGVTVSLGHNLDSDGTCDLVQSGDQSGALSAPLDPLLGPLQNNGGPTDTHALLADSPAIDAGDGTLAPAGTDQRGFSRIADGNQDGIPIIDIGAFEVHFIPINPGKFVDLVATSTVSSLNTVLPPGTDSFHLTFHYSADILPDTFVAKINGKDVTDLFNPDVPEGFETVPIPLNPGQNYLRISVKGTLNGRPAEEVEILGFRVGDPPFGRR